MPTDIHATATTTETGAMRSVTFIDAGIAGFADLLAALGDQDNVHVIPQGADGLSFIAATLAGEGPVDAVHVLSHGGPGVLWLGDLRFDVDTMAARAGDLATIRDALADGADILLSALD